MTTRRRRRPTKREARREATHREILRLIRAIRRNLTPDLLDRKHAWMAELGPTAGHCYVATEALYYLLGGRESGCTPHNAKVDGVQHWWLVDAEGNAWDATIDQFGVPDDRLYELLSHGRGRGFLTKRPSKRALILLHRVHKDLKKRR